MANSITSVPPFTEPEVPKTNEICEGEGDLALLFYGPPCRPADYTEPEDRPPTPILKTSKSEKCHKAERCHKVEEAKSDIRASRKEAKAEREAKCQPGCKFERAKCPKFNTNSSSSMVVRFAERGSSPRDKDMHIKVVIPMQTMTEEVYVNGQMTHREISDSRQVTSISYQKEEKEKLCTDKSAEGRKLEHKAGDNVSKNAKTAISTVASACLSKSKDAIPKKGKSLIPVMNNMMSMVGETEVSRLKNYRMREKNTLNSVQGITQWFLVSQAITLFIFLIIFIVLINVFGLLFVVVLFSRR
ncbi:hypothetical protein QFC19_009337 [Naganishia cerealis]|uniref:Uncharacterized protein n=1 Tax=Naganishia cerealis TaxID=610337 RepID=A0ACC2UVN9_9TREE|nr:hypothetical protein QFC19_009337 [Naganishia cerealis]